MSKGRRKKIIDKILKDHSPDNKYTSQSTIDLPSDYNAAVQAHVDRLRNANSKHKKNYIAFLEEVLPKIPIDPDDFQQDEFLDINFSKSLQRYLKDYYKNVFTKSDGISSIVKEISPSSRMRYLIAEPESFCSGIDIPLPENNICHLLRVNNTSDFVGKFHASLLTFGRVMLIDPLPNIFRWHSQSILDGGKLYDLLRDPDSYVEASTKEEWEQVLWWFSFIFKYRKLVEAGRIFIVNDSHRHWYFNFSSGSESDKPKIRGFEATLENLSYSFWNPGKSHAELADISFKTLLNDREREISEDLFWLNHYSNDGVLDLRSPDEAHNLIEHHNSYVKKLQSLKNQSASYGSIFFNLNFAYTAANVSANDITNAIFSDEYINAIQSSLRSIGNTIAVASPSDYKRISTPLIEKFHSDVRDIVGKASKDNWYSSIVRVTPETFLAAAGAALGVLVDTPVKTDVLIGTSLGSTLPFFLKVGQFIQKDRKTGHFIKVANRLVGANVVHKL